MRKNVQRRATLISVAALALSLTGCAQSSEETAESAPGSGESAASTQPSEPTDPALRISDPKDVGALSDPCAVLTQEQLSRLGATAEPTTEDTPWGEPSCSWSNDGVSIDVSGDSTSGGGFSRIRKNQDQFANYTETNVAGYPAARVNSTDLLCGVAVGISEEHTILINVAKFGSDDPQHSDPCAFAEKVFTATVKNVPAES